jgi:F-type H+-transporting ATPase subunit a
VDFWGEFSHHIELLLHELAVLDVTTGEPPVRGDYVVLTNYLVWMFIAFITCAIFFMIAAKKVSLVPKGVSNLAEMGVEFVRNNLVVETLGEEGAKYFPFVGTLFFFILFNNLWGIFIPPIGKPGTGSIGIATTLALIVFFFYHYEGIRKNGFFKFWGSFAPSGAPKGIKQIVWVLEFILNFMRPVTLAVRLFANMYAGHLVLGVFGIFALLFGQMAIELITEQIVGGALSIVGMIFMLILLVLFYLFELFVAVIQAYVFAMLTVQYINLSIHVDH